MNPTDKANTMTTTEPRRPKTRRGEGFASQGAVRQRGGALPIYICNTCHREVVWAESRRTGRKYLANVKRGYLGQRYYIGSDLHRNEDCQRRAKEGRP